MEKKQWNAELKSCKTTFFSQIVRNALASRTRVENRPSDRVNDDQSNLAKGGIAVASPRNCSFVFPRWQHRTDGLLIWLGVQHPKSPLPLGSSNTICHWKPQAYLPNGS